MVQNDKPIVKFLNIMVLLSSILVLVIISIELLSATTILSERFILNTHLMVCTIFLADFFVRWSYTSGIPAKTGVGGGVMGCLPGVFGIAAFAPPLDDAGNSVKAQAAIKYIARELGVNVFSGDTVEIIK